MIKKILIIDDSSVSRKIMKMCIPSDMGYEFDEAIDGEDGLKKYVEFQPDVVFLDLTMPVMDGREFLKELKKDYEDSVIIVCTADVQKKSLDEVMTLGALLVVKKPPSKETIQDALIKAEEKIESMG